ncbi:MICOS complex subunit MIC13 homolog QIL1 [Cimex lectularius]|uniref:MICOS complex subunit MIC13 n=1 Tax=Cimex lectularius TaxID=79782 RepID=A0A8I6RHC9_CIMLE|nr:MICOS complex subunit MIC13 homolog QIL1 [Cimex lectularius]
MSRLVKVGTKLGIVGTTIYYSVEYGVWKDSSKTEQLYKDLYKLAVPLLKEVPIETPELPKAAEVSLYVKTSWNHGIVTATKFILDLPEHASTLYRYSADWVSNQLNQESKGSES